MVNTTCLVCGAQFEPRPHGKAKKYCSKDCYEEAARSRARKRSRAKPRKPPEPCENCGELTRRYGRRVWCQAAECQRERNRRLRAEAYARNPGAVYRRHAHKWRVYNATRQARIKVRTVPGCTEEKIQARLAYFGFRCWMCGGPSEERDHVKPLSKGGLHCPANIRPSCRSCNRRKKDAWPIPTHLLRKLTPSP